MAGIGLDLSAVDLSVHGRIGPKEQLLSGLALGVKGPGDQDPPKGAVVQQSAVFPCKGNPLGHTLVDDVSGYLGQTVDVGLPGSIIPPFDGIVEQPVIAVPIPLIVLRGVDPPLGCNGVRPTGGILVAEGLYIISQFGQGGRCGTSGKAGPHHDNVDISLVGGVDKLDVVLMFGPFFGQGTGWNF